MLKKIDTRNLTIRSNSLLLQAYTFWLPTYVEYMDQNPSRIVYVLFNLNFQKQ